MSDPPSYEESTFGYGHQFDSNTDSKAPQRFSIREEVGASRSQNVAALIARLLPQIRDRAKQGLSKSTLLLLPSNQDCVGRGQLVGFPEDELPIIIQLEGCQDTLEFWLQEDALDQLQSQMFATIFDSVPTPLVEQPLPKRPVPPSKPSFFGRKQFKVPKTDSVLERSSAPISVNVRLEEVHFRTATEYGLFETIRGRDVLVTIDVR